MKRTFNFLIILTLLLLSNVVYSQYSNFYKERDYFVFRNASIKKAGVAFEIYLNEEITLPNENYSCNAYLSS